MLDFTKPIATRDGQKVRILSTEGPNSNYPIVGHREGGTVLLTWTTDGKYDPEGEPGGHRLDLVNVEEVKTYYLVVLGSGRLEGADTHPNTDEVECYEIDHYKCSGQRLKLTFRGYELVASEILQPEGG